MMTELFVVFLLTIFNQKEWDVTLYENLTGSRKTIGTITVECYFQNLLPVDNYFI